MEFLTDIGLFTGKALIITLSVVAILITIATLVAKNKPEKDQLSVTHLNERLNSYANALKAFILSKKEMKAHLKTEKEKKKKDFNPKRKVYLLDFDGDIKASAVDQLRDEVTAVLTTAVAGDEVIVRISSPGGMVHTYGLAAAQLLRLRQKELNLTICVDKVAASGGYLMACTGQKILAAPFAILGSIGVLAQIPNFHRLLKKNDVDYQEITAGEYKRTLTLFGEITDKGKEKFTEQIEDTHSLFKQFVKDHRPQLDLEKVGTGEYWYGQRALELQLIDEIKTSDDYILELSQEADIYLVKLSAKKKIAEKLADAMSASLSKAFETTLTQLKNWTV